MTSEHAGKKANSNGRRAKERAQPKGPRSLAPRVLAPRHRNSDLAETFCLLSEAVAIPDKFESAHGQLDGAGKLCPNATRRGPRVHRLRGAAPRVAHPSVLTATGHTYDEVFDWLHRARRDLNGIPGVGLEGEEEHGMTTVERAVMVYGYENVRSRTRGDGR